MEARKIFVILVIFPMDAVRARNRLADWRKDDPSATITLMETKGICSAASENRWKTTDGPERKLLAGVDVIHQRLRHLALLALFL
jgi:hypothetical protein